MAKSKKKILRFVIGAIVVFNIILFGSGHGYYYKALIHNYVNIDDLDLFPVRKVAAGQPQPWNIAVDYNKAQLTPELRKTLEQYRSVAFLVIQNDSIRYEEYWDSYGKESLSNSFSSAKSVVGLLIGIAISEGKIKSLDQPVCDYLDWFCEGRQKEVTIRHLLIMSSGIDWDEGYASLNSSVTRLYYDNDLEQQMKELVVKENPGSVLNYMSCNTELLAFVLREATGMTLSEYASEKLWKPIGAEHDAFWSLDSKDGMEKAYCCLYSNARDFARLGKLLLHDGRWGDKQVVPEWYVHESITPAPLTDGGEPNKTYGYQWWMTTARGEKVFYARGILGQYIVVIPAHDIIFVRLGHERSEKGPDGQLLDIPIYLEEVMKMYIKTIPFQADTAVNKIAV